MLNKTRRRFLQSGAAGLGALGAGGLLLAAGFGPTPATDNAAEADRVLAEIDAATGRAQELPQGTGLTPGNPLGPAYRAGAPFRAKLTPPFEPGTTLVVSGRVWAHDTRQPLPRAVIDVWHVDVNGVYSSAEGDFRNRARLVTADDGSYEFESIHPVAYQPGPTMWRSAHIHWKVAAPGYTTLVTELFFEGDPHQDEDPIFKASLRVPIVPRQSHGRRYETARFEIVLASGKTL